MLPSDHWYKNAIIYTLGVESFQDDDGDGVGDFQGLTRRLDYLSGLGVTCLWLLPFYPSPMCDHGYDITDYYGVNARNGTLGRFVEFMREATDRGIRVLVDLVVNHTSDQHPWFQASRSNAQSRFRHWYVWEKDPDLKHAGPPGFPGPQKSIWTYDDQAQAYYLHHFYKFQPDLNVNHHAVRQEITRIMGFWLELGVSGFRVDAAPFLIEDTTARREHGDRPPDYAFLTEIREFLDRRRGDAILLAEANVEPERIPKYVENDTRFQMLFNFVLNQYLFLALARREAAPLAKGLKLLPPLPSHCQFANFVRNHDELALDRLTESERQEVFKAFAPDPDMRLYGRGIRRRLPPMLGGDKRRIEMTYSLMFTLPGTPVLRYGEEIGMGDDLSIPDRGAVRTAMQWNHTANAGFSTAAPDALACDVIREGPYGYERVHVADQEQDANSLMNRIEKMIRIRRHCPEFGRGECKVLETGDPGVFAHATCWAGRTVVAAHNLSDRTAEVMLRCVNPAEGQGELAELLGDQPYPPARRADGDGIHLRLDAYGFRWLALSSAPRPAD